ncbi:DUF7500 family protein [Halobaculum litoreum]|uniref:DUF7500 family protein n=1 Tax=Halobaculum litoreum TaxID=3031998 RepID=UPI0024C45406|nr:hypothetical protein [Halobaculum sp. DT92]
MSDDAPRGNPGVDPDDLDISKSEYVRELGDDRYVVSAGSRPPRAPREEATGDAADERAADPDPPDRAAGVAETAEAVREGLDPNAGPGAAADPAGPAAPTGRPSGDGSPTAGSDPATDRDAGTDGLPRDPAGTTTDPASGSVEGARPASHDRRGAPRGGAESGADPGDLDARAVGQWLAASLADTEFAYGFDATLSIDGRTTRHRMASDDVGETFETLVTWFATAAAGDTPPEAALGILLSNMDDGPTLPPNAVRAALARLGMARDDTMEDLLVALEDAGGLRL